MSPASPRAVVPLLLAFALSAAPLRGQAKDPDAHPLDPLSVAEVKEAGKLLKDQHGKAGTLLFPMIHLHEPTKEELAGYGRGKPIPRRATAVLMDLDTYKTFEGSVDLDKNIARLKELPGVLPFALVTEMNEVEKIVQDHPGWRAAMRKRGIEDVNDLYVAPWASGEAPADKAGRPRLFRVIAYYRGGAINPFGGPVEGVMAVVDLATRKVTIRETENIPIPPDAVDFFDPKERGPERKGLKPLHIRQPDGPSYTRRGHEVRWQKWRFRYALHPREGLVLYQVGYEDGDKVRPILDRASLSEMVVPYGDPDPIWNWRAPFDQGEYGIGHLASPLQPGEDVPENAELLPAVFFHDFGQPRVVNNAVALFERDGGLLWKHYEESAPAMITRRARELVIRYVATVGNYEYGFNWVFRQDGTLKAEVDLTGIVLPKAVASDKCALCEKLDDRLGKGATKAITLTPEGDQRYGTLIGKQVVAVNHQHIFNFRLDFAVDGPANSFSEMNVRAHEGEGNPRGNAFFQEETLFAREREARRSISLPHSRCWKVFNPGKRNALGHHTAYALIPAENSVPYLGKDSLVRKRAGFMNHHVWATRYHPEELHAAGDYPRQNPREEGLPKWSGDESIVNTDLVVWYTLITTHIPRPEEWPVMPTAQVSFRLVPWGFFSRNPALDVPPQPGR